ncbi:MAG: methylated-DNA--[protein]-cysteine S-methyltransferase [Syntrophobacteraceae bacterium]
MDRAVGYEIFDSPVGWLLAAAGAEGICLMHLCGRRCWPEDEIREHLRAIGAEPAQKGADPSGLLPLVRDALEKYFREGRPLPDFPLDMGRGTPFQRAVWKALCSIPFGETRSYIEIAREVGRPRASRAVGGACGRNPIAILVPCHRVVASGGGLGGYSGGLEYKEFLLRLESAHRAGSRPLGGICGGE